MRMLARPLHRPRGRRRLFHLSRSVLPQSVRPSFLPSLQQIRSNQRVSQLHPLSRAHLQPGDTTDRRRGKQVRQAGTHPRRPRPLFDIERRARRSGTVEIHTMHKKAMSRNLEWAYVQDGLQSGLSECTRDKKAKLFDGGSCSTRQICARVNRDELGFAGCTPIRRDAVMQAHREFRVDAE